MRDWVTNVRTTHYLLGSALGAHPYPMMVRDFQAVIGAEARGQFVAADGGAARPSRGLRGRRLQRHRPLPRVPRRPGGDGRRRGGRPLAPGRGITPRGFWPQTGDARASACSTARETYLLQDEAGNVLPTHSVSAGLDYPAVGPEHAWLHDQGRVRYTSVGDDEALAAFHLLAEVEGIMPALESAHAVAWVVREAASLRGKRILLNLSGRGDKDLGILG